MLATATGGGDARDRRQPAKRQKIGELPMIFLGEWVRPVTSMRKHRGGRRSPTVAMRSAPGSRSEPFLVDPYARC